MSSSNQSLAESFYKAVSEGQIERATSVFADDLTWVEPPFPGHPGGIFHGKQNILANVLGVFVRTWEDLKVTPHRFVAAGNDVVTLGEYTGVNASTGRPMRARFVHTWTFRDGQAVRFEMLADTIQFFLTADPPLNEPART